MNFVGLDLSFTETGMVIITEEGNVIEQELFSTDNKKSPEDRIIHIGVQIFHVMSHNIDIEMVYVEDKFVGKNKKQVLYDGGLLYHIITELKLHQYSYKIINPTTLKSFVIGTKGAKKGSKKELMLLHCFKRWGVEFENNNLCDAYCLARLAMEETVHSIKKSLSPVNPTGNVKRLKRKT